MTSASPSPKSPELSEKTKKYDRQLRLWGDHGQAKLEGSRICMINASATGTEILKSLILPGCGSFTILDNSAVSLEDIGNNFFLDSESIGKNRGETARQFLLDLNPDVSGEAIDNHPESIIEQDPGFFSNFTVVIASQLSEKALLALSKTLWNQKVPFVYCHCVGLIGWIRVQLVEHTIIESHPDSQIEDLRLDAPFPELTSHMNAISLTERAEVLKTPWLVLLYKTLQAYVAKDAGKLDSAQNGNGVMDTLETTSPFLMNSREKRAFKDFVREYLQSLGLTDADEPFEETVKAVNTALSVTRIPSAVTEILNDPKAAAPQDLSKFWVMCAGVKKFVETHNQLPLRGTLPDMTADSQKYITLQNAYREKANKDADEVLEYCLQVLGEAKTERVTLRTDEVRLFCKESYNLRLIRGRPLFEELESSPVNILQELAQNVEDVEEDKMYYIMFRGLLRFQTEFNTYPGAATEFESDITRFKPLMSRLLNEWNSSLTIKDDFIHEICRYGASEIPSVAAFIGGCVAQEVIKIITSQYVPLNNTLIYNAVNSTTTSFTS